MRSRCWSISIASTLRDASETKERFSSRQAFSMLTLLKLLFRKLKIQRQRSGYAIRKIGHSDQHVQIHNLLVRKMFFEVGEVGVASAVRSAREFFVEPQRCLFRRAKAEGVSSLQGLHLFPR